jgi:hypothetical protein
LFLERTSVHKEVKKGAKIHAMAKLSEAVYQVRDEMSKGTSLPFGCAETK